MFDPISQEKDLSIKIVAGLQRISEAFKVLLWQKAKVLGLSPIQIQMLIFIAYHKPEFCNVSHLAKEFNLTKPTVSDAIRILDKKELITKDYSPNDNRRYTILLSKKGKEIVEETESFAFSLKSEVGKIGQEKLEALFTPLSELIYQLNQSGILTVQRTCYGCKFYQKSNGKHHCNFLGKDLLNSEIRIDCAEFEEK